MTEAPKQILFVLKEGLSGSERPYNALRHGMELAKEPEFRIRVFPVGDAAQLAAIRRLANRIDLRE